MLSSQGKTEDMATKRKSKNTDKWYWNWISRQIYLIAGTIIISLAILFTLLQFITRHNKELTVPSFANTTLSQAAAIAQTNNLRLEVTDSVYIPRMTLGTVYRQNPEAGSKVKKNRRVLLTINAKIPRKVNMPSLVGFSLRQAQSELAANQLKIGRLIYVEDIAANNVISQLYKGSAIPPGRQIPSGSEIDLTLGINEGERETYIPDLKLTPYQSVKGHLIENYLNLGRAVFDNTVKNYTDSLEAVVYRQFPPASDTLAVPMGTDITVYLTKDKTLIPKDNNQQ